MLTKQRAQRLGRLRRDIGRSVLGARELAVQYTTSSSHCQLATVPQSLELVHTTVQQGLSGVFAEHRRIQRRWFVRF